MSYTQKSPLAPATQALLELMRTAKLQTPTGPTVAGQAVQAAQQPPEAQGAVPPAPPEQQGIASILDQAKDAAPTIVQNQQNDQAEQTAQMAAQMMQQGQQPQPYAEGGIASLPVDVSDFAEGGVLGYAAGGISEPTPASIQEWMNTLGPKPDEEMEKEEKRLYEEQKLLRASRPDTAAQRALGMKEAYNKELAYRPTEEAIASFLGGAQGLGGFAKAAVNTREVFAKRDAANREGEQAQRDLEYAQKIGDNDAIQKALAARRNAKLEYDKLTAAVAGDSMRTQTGIMTNKASIYNTELDAQTAKANQAAQERIANMGGVEGAMFRLSKEDPDAYAKFMAGRGGSKTHNLKDPNYVANMISDNVTQQMDKMMLAPQIGMSIATPADFSALRNKLIRDEAAKFQAMGADVSQIMRETPSDVTGDVPPAVQAVFDKYGIK